MIRIRAIVLPALATIALGIAAAATPAAAAGAQAGRLGSTAVAKVTATANAAPAIAAAVSRVTSTARISTATRAGAATTAPAPTTGPTSGAQHASGTGTAQCKDSQGNTMDGVITYSPTTLWPPDHRMTTINISYSDTDNDGDQASLTVGMITDNQMANGQELKGSGQPAAQQGPDWSGTGNTTGQFSDPGSGSTTAQVRSERSGTDKAGRTYSIQVMCSESGGIDPSEPSESTGQMGTATLTVFVPHDMGNN